MKKIKSIMLKEKEAEDFLEASGFKVVERALISKHAELLRSAKKIGFPLVMKDTSSVHKSEHGGVIMDVTESSLESAYSHLKSKSALIQKQLRGIELILGIKKDPSFGHFILCGAGGIYAELKKDVSFRVLPIDRGDAVSMLNELEFGRYFAGLRGKSFDAGSVINSILKLSSLVKKHPEIVELDINPLIVNSEGAFIVDARILIKK